VLLLVGRLLDRKQLIAFCMIDNSTCNDFFDEVRNETEVRYWPVIGRSLRSASSQRYEGPLTKLKFGERSFSFAGSAAWNALTPELHNLLNTHTFKKQLKTYLFKKAYSCYSPTSNCNALLVTPGVNGAVEMTLFVFVLVFQCFVS